MFKSLNLVMTVMFIIIGGWIIFFDGRGWCINCRSTIDLLLGVVAIVLGLAGLATSFNPGNVGAPARE